MSWLSNAANVQESDLLPGDTGHNSTGPSCSYFSNGQNTYTELHNPFPSATFPMTGSPRNDQTPFHFGMETFGFVLPSGKNTTSYKSHRMKHRCTAGSSKKPECRGLSFCNNRKSSFKKSSSREEIAIKSKFALDRQSSYESNNIALLLPDSRTNSTSVTEMRSMSIFGDISSSSRDMFGGRSSTSQSVKSRTSKNNIGGSPSTSQSVRHGTSNNIFGRRPSTYQSTRPTPSGGIVLNNKSNKVDDWRLPSPTRSVVVKNTNCYGLFGSSPNITISDDETIAEEDIFSVLPNNASLDSEEDSDLPGPSTSQRGKLTLTLT